MNVNFEKNILINRIYCKMIHYNHKKYWKYRTIVVNKDDKTPKIIKFFMLYYIKKCDAFNCASMGTDLNAGAQFDSPPILVHGLNGIIVSHYAKIGKNVTIFQRVTIAEDTHIKHRSATIGDNVIIGAGAVIIGDINIGNNVKIGANAVVTKSIPDNCTVVGVPGKIINKN